jgi:transcriptional regulator with XRE-family HTH domain
MPDCTPPGYRFPGTRVGVLRPGSRTATGGVHHRSAGFISGCSLLPLSPVSLEAPSRTGTDHVEPVALRTVLAGNLRRLREGHGTPYDEIIRAAGVIGLEWTATWLTALEKGTKSPTAEQLLALPVVLTATYGQRVTLAELLATDDPILLGPETAVRPRHLRDLVTGTPERPLISLPVPEPPAQSSPAIRAAEKMREIRRAGFGTVDMRALSRAEEGAGDAEAKLARKLGITPIRVIAAAASLWGRSLTEERDHRVTVEGGAPATVLRKLTTDLTIRLDEARGTAALD